MMSWEAVPKSLHGPRLHSFPCLRVYRHTKHRYIKASGNVLATALLPREVVFLRDGNRVAIRAAREDEPRVLVRKVSPQRHSQQCSIAIGSVDLPDGEYRLVPNGDLFLLEPLPKGAR